MHALCPCISTDAVLSGVGGTIWIWIHVELLRIKDWSLSEKSTFHVCAGVELDAEHTVLIDDERNEMTLFEGGGAGIVKYEEYSPWILRRLGVLWILIIHD